VSSRTAIALVFLALGYGMLVQAFAQLTLPPWGPLHGLLGPAAELFADVQWIRFTRARLRGEHDRALAFAESALELDPSSTDGWEYLATHLATFHASSEREPEPALREAWFRAGLEVTRRGALQASDPGRLALTRALLCLNRAQLDPALDPEQRAHLLAEARSAAEEAQELGTLGAAELLD